MAFVVYDSTPIRVLNSEYVEVVVPDTTPPTITLGGGNPATVQAGAPFVEAYTAVDNDGTNLTSAVVVTGTVDTMQIGAYPLQYMVSDAAGNVTTVNRIVNVVDTLGPTLTLEGPNPQFVTVGTPYVELPYTAIDLYDGNLTDKVMSAGSVNTAVIGDYIIQYLVLDSSGNRAQAVRNVKVVAAGSGGGGGTPGNGDERYPNIVLYGDTDMELAAGSDFAEPGFTASDSTDGNLTAHVRRDGFVDTDRPGLYPLVYTVSNSLGFTGVAVRKVTVLGNSLSLDAGSCTGQVGYSWGNGGS